MANVIGTSPVFLIAAGIAYGIPLLTAFSTEIPKSKPIFGRAKSRFVKNAFLLAASTASFFGNARILNSTVWRLLAISFSVINSDADPRHVRVGPYCCSSLYVGS